MSHHQHIVPLGDSDLPGFVAAVEQRYAHQKAELGSVDPDEARRQARVEVEAIVSGGQLQAGHTVLEARDSNGHGLGSVWLAPHRSEVGLAFIYDLFVNEGARGQGVGRALLRAAADWARTGGYQALGLHVFGANTGAIGLYESEGYAVTDVLMRRSL